VKKKPARARATDETPVAAVARACSLLDAFRTGPAMMTLAELSERTGLYKSTTLRLAATLEQYGLLQKNVDGRYHVGATTFQLAKRYQTAMTPEAVLLPILRWLVDETRESAGFHVSVGGRRMCLYQVDSPELLRSHFKPTEVLPLDRGAGGRALTLYAGGLAALPKNAPLVITASNEVSAGMTGLACPVFDANGQLAGVVSLSGPSARLDKAALARARHKLVQAAQRATLGLGGDIVIYESRKGKAETA
jgi:DNA-binding IclR family transcriptional regulator